MILALSVKASESLTFPGPGRTLSFHVSREKGNSAPLWSIFSLESLVTQPNQKKMESPTFCTAKEFIILEILLLP